MKQENGFFNLQMVGGILLFFSAVVALILSNSSLSTYYNDFLKIPVEFSIGNFIINKPLLLWVNDGLMAIYFLMVGLEIKREIRRGVLSDKTSVFVPAIAALCGLLVPAAIFYSLNHHDDIYLKGWAIPTATDIAFTLGILSLLGSRVPFSLKILLTAIAIFDDMAAIVIIAIFYTHKLSFLSLSMAAFFSFILLLLNYFNVRRMSIFVAIGVCLWMAVLKSGVHATLAGIVLAMAIPDKPLNNTGDTNETMLSHMENGLHPWISFFILPMFAIANAGVSFAGMSMELLSYPIVTGCAFGLFFGKQIGIFMPLFYFVKRRGYLRSDNVNLGQVYGIALICGVGFTMSLFIGSLAYQYYAPQLMNMVKIGVVFGSLCSGVFGYFVLHYFSRNPQSS